jgi:hypothetical protein
LPLSALAAPGIGHQALDHVPVHQRFTAEKVHVQRLEGAGLFDQIVDGAHTHLVGHQRPLALIAPLAGKAVLAIEVAGMGHVQAKRLDKALAGCELHAFVRIGRKQLAGGLQLRHVRDALADLGFGDLLVGGILFQHAPDDLLRRRRLPVQRNHVVGQGIDGMHRTAVYVQAHVEAVSLY